MRSVIATAHFALLGGLVLVGAIVALRRLAGGAHVPLAEMTLAATGAAFAAICLAARIVGARLQGPDVPHWLARVADLVPLVACGLLTAGVLLPGTPLVGACLLVALLAVEETWCLARGIGWSYGVGSQFRGPQTVASPQSGSATKLTPDPLDAALDAASEAVEQQFTRRRGPAGEEVLEGYVRVRFAEGQRTAEAHLAFCPPLEHRPKVEYEAVSGPAARIALGQVLPLGARLDVKLAQAATQDTSLVVRFRATTDAQHAADSVISPLCA